MPFSEFFKVYEEDVRPRLKLNTWLTKEHITRTKILPFFGSMKMCDISPADIVKWENGLPRGDYSQTYLRTMVNQLSAAMNHAVRFYRLPSNPILVAGKIGSKSPEAEMQFWTQEEYVTFVDAIASKPEVFHAFEILYWCGLRVGELLALTKEEVDLKSPIIRVRHSYQRIKGEDVITSPKTKKSVRDVLMPDFLRDELEDYLATLPDLKAADRIFTMTKHKLKHEMQRGCDATGIKPIRIHNLRHSHVSLLIELGFSPLAIAGRLGHETTEITMTCAHLFPSAQQGLADALNEAGARHE